MLTAAQGCLIQCAYGVIQCAYVWRVKTFEGELVLSV